MIPDLEVAKNCDGRDVLWRVDGDTHTALVHRTELDDHDPRLWDALIRGLRDRGDRGDRGELHEPAPVPQAVTAFLDERPQFITALKNCPADNLADYHRWQGHAEARRQLAEQLEETAR